MTETEEISQPAWQLTQLLERSAGVAHHEGHWSVALDGDCAAAETLDGALEALGDADADAEPARARN